MNRFFNNIPDRVIRLFLAVFCPPLAVADKGCAVFIPVLVMYVIQIAATSVIFLLSLYFTWYFCVDIPLGQAVVRFLGIGEVFAEISTEEVDFSIKWLWMMLRCQALLFIGLSIVMAIHLFCNILFGLVASGVNFILGFIPILIAVIVCLLKNEDPLRPEDMAVSIWRDGIFSWASLRRLFVGADRVVLCMIYPPLAVADLGWKKVLLVYLINLFGMYPGAAAVFFCVIKKYSSKPESKKELKK